MTEIIWTGMRSFGLGKRLEVEQGWREVHVEEKIREHRSVQGFGEAVGHETYWQDQASFQNLPEPHQVRVAVKQPQVEMWVAEVTLTT